MVVSSINWVELSVGAGLSAVGSAIVGLMLWLFLPRGATLTSAIRTHGWNRPELLDTWEVKNISAVPIEVRSVRIVGLATLDQNSGKFEELELPLDGFAGTTLGFDQETREHPGAKSATPWRNVLILPGETLEAHVNVNTTLLIDYRRAGRSGLLERRQLAVHGFA